MAQQDTLVLQIDSLGTIQTVKINAISRLSLVFYHSGMSIDADGAPNCYHPQSEKGLDDLKYAGKTGNWWALVTDNNKSDGKPILQGKDDPQPGFYVSMTSLQDAQYAVKNPKRYVDATQIPYIVLPKQFCGQSKLGDITWVYNTQNQKSCFAICADVGSKDHIGEGSVYLAQQLGIAHSPRTGGAPEGVHYFIFNNSGNGKPLSIAEINRIGASHQQQIFLSLVYWYWNKLPL